VVQETVDFGNLRSPRFRVWQGRVLHPIEEVRMFFDDKGPVPETFRRLRTLLAEAKIEHIFVGAIAANAHGFRRSTEDVDLCMRREDLERFRREFVGKEFAPVEGRPRRFYDPVTQVTFDILVAGEIAGNTRKQRDVRFPDPSESEIIEGAPFVSLARLIELKLVTWRYQDWADVVSLIRLHDLDESYGDRFNALVRSAYLQCYDQKAEEDRYNPEIHDQPPEE
jgi:hypothetical protein